MQSITTFTPGHSDLIHDISYNFYGLRLATCSSDQHIKVWDKQSVTSAPSSSHRWVLNESWKAHDAAVLKVCWAAPEYGQIIASCSFDRSIRIWEEYQDDYNSGNSSSSGAQGQEITQARRWTEKARLVDSRGTVQDVKFAPAFSGLKLATVSVDGVVRVYEAMDVVNLAHWTLMEDFEVASTSSNLMKEKDTEYSLSWCQSRSLPPLMVVGCAKDQARVYQYDDSGRKWSCVETLSGHGDLIHNVCWAPSIGRSCQLIATACKDKRVRIYELQVVDGGKMQYKVALVAELDGHEADVWRVEWNTTGSILASSGDDGKVLLWKRDMAGEWKLMYNAGQSGKDYENTDAMR